MHHGGLQGQAQALRRVVRQPGLGGGTQNSVMFNEVQQFPSFATVYVLQRHLFNTIDAGEAALGQRPTGENIDSGCII